MSTTRTQDYVVKVAVQREDIMFNSKIVVYTLSIEGIPVLHVIDRATHFQAEKFLADISIENIWRTLMQNWILLYLGVPENLRHDQSTHFVSVKLQKLAIEAGTKC